MASLNANDEVIVAAHGNSLRDIVMHLKNISEEDILKLNIPRGMSYVFEFDKDLNVTKDYLLGDPEEIEKLIDVVDNQENR